MESDTWKFTEYYESTTAEHLENINDELELEEGELPIASTIVSPDEWTFVTTRKIIGRIGNRKSSVFVGQIEKWNWEDFKGRKTEGSIQRFTINNSESLKFVYETKYASMVMIYAVMTISRLCRNE